MENLLVEQALYGSHGPGGYRFLARSPGFRDEWLPVAERLCTGFGDRPAGVACPACVFAQPLGKQHVAIVQVADQGSDDAGRPGALGFHLLVLERKAYEGFGGDPFALAERVVPDWQARSDLPTLSWPAEPLPSRTVEQVRQVLQRPNGPELLGGSQVLVDGGRLVFERPVPDTALMHGLWTLLPTGARSHLWPASFAFGNALNFDAVVVPRAARDDYLEYVTEQQAGEYPEGRYEWSLQVAAEAGDQRELDTLFARRSRRDVWRLGLVLLVVALVLPLVLNLLAPPPEDPKPAATPPKKMPAPAAVPDLPAPRTLNAADRQRFTKELADFAGRLGADVPHEPTAEDLLGAIDRKLDTPDPQRDPEALAAVGPLESQLRALLWKQGMEEYKDPKYNCFELLEHLDRKVHGQQPGGKE